MEEKVLQYIGSHGACDEVGMSCRFELNFEESRKILEKLYAEGKLVAYVTPDCEKTGESLLPQRLERVSLEDYVCNWSPALKRGAFKAHSYQTTD